MRCQGMPVQEIRSSSAIERVAYDEVTRNLSVWFKGGRRYIYADVPAHLYEALTSATSLGAFVNSWVKGIFSCRREPAQRVYADG